VRSAVARGQDKHSRGRGLTKDGGESNWNAQRSAALKGMQAASTKSVICGVLHQDHPMRLLTPLPLGPARPFRAKKLIPNEDFPRGKGKCGWGFFLVSFFF